MSTVAELTEEQLKDAAVALNMDFAELKELYIVAVKEGGDSLEKVFKDYALKATNPGGANASNKKNKGSATGDDEEEMEYDEDGNPIPMKKMKKELTDTVLELPEAEYAVLKEAMTIRDAVDDRVPRSDDSGLSPEMSSLTQLVQAQTKQVDALLGVVKSLVSEKGKPVDNADAGSSLAALLGQIPRSQASGFLSMLNRSTKSEDAGGVDARIEASLKAIEKKLDGPSGQQDVYNLFTSSALKSPGGSTGGQ